MKAFPRSVHSGYGSAECFCPDGTETRKEQYAELVGNIISHLSDIPLMFSEVAMRKNLVTDVVCDPPLRDMVCDRLMEIIFFCCRLQPFPGLVCSP